MQYLFIILSIFKKILFYLLLLDTDSTVWTNESYPIMIPNLNCLGNETKLNHCDSKIGTYIQGCTYNAVNMKCLSGI